MYNKKIIVVFGGSFNPPINSHFSLAEQIACEYEIVDKVVFVPVNQKYNKSGLICNEHRYNMLKIGTKNNDNFLVSRVELDQERQLYTIETLELLKKEYINYNIWFTIGTDNLKELHTWKKAKELVEDFKILVLERGDDDMDDIILNNEFLKKYQASFIKVKENIKSNISSTFVRNKLLNNKSIRYLTTEGVFNYIKDNKLFKKI